MNIIKKLVFCTALISYSSDIFAKTMENDNKWHISIAPYFWAASISSNVTVSGLSSKAFIPFYKVLDNFDGGGELHLEGGYGPWTAMVDPTYIKLSKDFRRGPILANLSVALTLIDTGLFYRVWESAFAQTQSLSLEVLGGARYLGLSNTLRLGFTRSKNMDVIAPIVGGRLKYNFNPKIHFWLRGDIGGFGVDSVRNTWATTVGGAYSITPYIDLGLAYRVLQFDIRQSAQNSSNSTMYGLLLGFNLHF